VIYDISLVYGYNVGMKISSADSSCDAFACTISSGCVSNRSVLSLCLVDIGLSPSPGPGLTHATPLVAHLRARAMMAHFLLVEEAASKMGALALTVLSTTTLVLMPTPSLIMTAQVCISILFHPYGD